MSQDFTAMDKEVSSPKVMSGPTGEIKAALASSLAKQLRESDCMLMDGAELASVEFMWYTPRYNGTNKS
jgi:hypothetical protein